MRCAAIRNNGMRCGRNGLISMVYHGDSVLCLMMGGVAQFARVNFCQIHAGLIISAAHPTSGGGR